MLLGAKQFFERSAVPVGYSNTGIVNSSCFKCALPPGFSAVGHTITFWGRSPGRSSAMISGEDNCTFFKLGTYVDGIGLSCYRDCNFTMVSLLEENVAWSNWSGATPSTFAHYAVVISSARSVSVYVNGVKRITNTSNNFRKPTGWFSICGYAEPVYYAQEGRYLTRTLNGTVSRVAIFGSAFDANDVAGDMQLGANIPSRNDLQHLWIYSTKDEVGDWNMETVSPAHLSDETPWS